MIYLDFDGVLFDSAREAYVISCLAAKKPYKIPDEKSYQRFLRARVFVTAAWNYEAVMNSLDDNLEDSKLYSYLNKIFTSGPTKSALIFEKTFFQERAKESLRDHRKWLGLSPPYPFWNHVLPLIKNYVNEFTILSTKDEFSIKEMLEFHNAPLNLRIFGREAYEKASRSKASIINNDPLRGNSSLFLDDSPEHLSSVKEIQGIRVILARWGYVSAESYKDNTDEALIEINEMLRGKDVLL